MDQPANHQNPINLHSFHCFDDQDHDPTLFMDDDSLQMFELLDTNPVSIKQEQNYYSDLGFQDFDPIDEYLSLWELWDGELPLLSYSDDHSNIDQCHRINDETGVSTAVGATTTIYGGSNGGRRMRLLEFEEISKHFEMPMSMAARKLGVGMTVLKKRCRELNIKRWPHRKLKSLKSLIQNVKELGLKEEIEMLEEQQWMIERQPEVEFTERTKKLRQACFKASYKKRKLGFPHYP